MLPVPTLFVLKKELNGKATDWPYNKYSRAILAGSDAWTPRRKYNGVPMLYDAAGSWRQGMCVRSDEKPPTGFVATHRSKRADADGIPKLQFGWAPVGKKRKDLLQQALQRRDIPNLVGGETYELCGPGIADNFEGLEGPQLFRHSRAEICLDLHRRPLTYEFLRQYFTTTLAAVRWEGIVWHGPVMAPNPARVSQPFMVKLRVEDFLR